MTIKNKIEELIKKYPKHFGKMITNNEEYWNWVNENSTTNSSSPAAKIYSALYNDSGICTHGKNKIFNSINLGFRYCGKSSTCICAKKSVSEKVSLTKSLRTDEQIKLENEKRIKTTESKYGVTNNFQTSKAVENHKLVYEDENKTAKITERIKNTKKERHGLTGFNNRQKAKSTNLNKYGVENTWSLSESKQNPNLQILKDINSIKDIFPKLTVEEISTKLNVHKQTVYYYLGIHGLREPYKSTFEQEIVSFLNDNGIINIQTNIRSLIKKEIDIFIPEFNLAIEYNGEYWHHDEVPHVNKTYHHDKFIECEKKGITLFTIFGNSWRDKKNIWKKKIISKIGKSEKIYARNTKIVKLSPKETKTFLNENHVQGYCVSQICYGLSDGLELVAVMTFSKNRSGVGKKRSDDTYELVRYASSKTVVGGASKLLKYFIKEHNPQTIISYSDNQYSVGNLYKKLGFILEKENKVGYWYYDPIQKKYFHRYKFAKHRLVKEGFDPSKTENEIMKNRGFLRIYDCGSRTWMLVLQNED